MFSNSLNVELIFYVSANWLLLLRQLIKPFIYLQMFHSFPPFLKRSRRPTGVANNIIQTELTTQRTADWLRSWGGDGVTQHLLLTLSAVQQSGCKFRTEQWKSQNKVNQKNHYFDYYNSTIIYLWVLCTVWRKRE